MLKDSSGNPVTFIPYNKNTVIEEHGSSYNPLMFTMDPIDQLGTVRKAHPRTSPPLSFILNKDTALPLTWRKGRPRFKIEGFNIFNSAQTLPLPVFYNFTGEPGGTLTPCLKPSATAGQITSIVGNQREIQLSLKLIF